MPNWRRKDYEWFSTLGSYFVAKLPYSGRNDDAAGCQWIFSGGFRRIAVVKEPLQRLTGTWTVDSGASAELDFGFGLQERGYTSHGTVSQTVGVGGAYKFWNQDTGFQLPSSENSVYGIYGGIVNKVGGGSYSTDSKAENMTIGINYGGYNFGGNLGKATSAGLSIGLVVDPSKVIGNFIDSYQIITGRAQ